jgi:putative membrane protein
MLKMAPILLAALVSAALVFAAAAAAAPPPPGVSGLDQEYLKMSAAGDAFEVEGGKIALQRSGDSKLHGYARMLIRDHSKSLKETLALAQRLGVKGVQGTPTKSQSWELKSVGRLSGGAFHRWYLLLEAHDHKDDISEARNERDNGFNTEVRQSAAQELPMLVKHLTVAERLLPG